MNTHQCVITDCMTAINVNAVNDRLLLTIWPIYMIIICMDAHQRVITDCNQCMSCSQGMYLSMYYIQSKFFFSIFFLFYYSNDSYCIFLVLK